MRGCTYSLTPQWESAVEGWLNWLYIAGISTQTLRLRRGHVRMVARRSKTYHPSELTREHLRDLCSQYKWSNDHRKGLRTSLHSFYEWCIAQELATDNVAECLPKVRDSAPCPRPAPDWIWTELLEQATPRERLMALLAGEAGLRRSEVALSHRDDLFDDGIGSALIVHGKGGKQRIVPVTDRLASAIRAHCNRGYLFPGQIVEPGQTDGHISAHYVGKLIGDLMPDGWSMHKLRHRYATRGYAGTGNLRAVQEALGHASVATTQRYTAVSSSQVRSVSEAAGAGFEAM